ncbi:MAG: G8 domain-containing protein [Deltaproteobacteria bacterium]|nr:G8 domain-containing protein [Deltaproteobacteria bacterium]
MSARRWMLRGLLVPAMLAGCGSESGDEANGREGPGGGSGVVGPTVSVKPGETVVVASDTCAKEPAGIFVEGELVVPDDADIEICARFILVQGGGRLRAGTEGAPFVHKLTITLSAPDAKENVMEMGTKFIGAMGGGVIDLHGSAPATAWSKLTGPVAAGATSFDVLEATGWKVGDEIVVASSTVEGPRRGDVPDHRAAWDRRHRGSSPRESEDRHPPNRRRSRGRLANGGRRAHAKRPDPRRREIERRSVRRSRHDHARREGVHRRRRAAAHGAVRSRRALSHPLASRG